MIQIKTKTLILALVGALLVLALAVGGACYGTIRYMTDYMNEYVDTTVQTQATDIVVKYATSLSVDEVAALTHFGIQVPEEHLVSTDIKTKSSFRKMKLPLEEEYQKDVYYLCRYYGVDLALALAVMQVESGMNSNNRRLMGVISNTLYACGVTDASQPSQNIHAGVYLLWRKLRQYNGNVSMALMSYNMGDGGAGNLFSHGIYSTDYSKAVIKQQAKMQAIIEATYPGGVSTETTEEGGVEVEETIPDTEKDKKD